MAGPKKKVLLVDDEIPLLEALGKYLELDRKRYDLLTASDGKKALDIVEREEISLVVSDIFMPEISGIQLLNAIKDKRPETAVILMTAYPTPTIRLQAEKSGCVQFIGKPFELSQLRKLILAQLDKRDDEGFVGTLRKIQLVDLIQMCCLSPVTMSIQVTRGGEKGVIFLQDGEIVHASCEDIEGEEAFYEILGWGSGNFETLPPDKVPVVNIEKNWQSLLMEAARRIDEKDAGQSGGPEDGGGEAREDSSGNLWGEDDIMECLDFLEAPDSCEAGRIGVLIVEDSAMMFKALEKILCADKNIEVVGKARNGAEALEKVGELSPDLITLDVNMPVMDGGTALKHIMIRNPCPVVIVSSMGKKAQTRVLDFLRLGAVDFIGKPSNTGDQEAYRKRFIETVKVARGARTSNFKRVKNHKVIRDKSLMGAKEFECERLVIVKSGPGGYAEVMRIVPELPRMLNCSVLVFQSMSADLASPLATYLGDRCIAPVFEFPAPGADDRSKKVSGGLCFIGSEDAPYVLVKKGSEYYLELLSSSEEQAGPDGSHFDRFLVSAADCFSGPIQLIFLSGAQMQGVEGVRRIKAKGGSIVAQSPSTAMVPAPVEKIISKGMADMKAAPPEIIEYIIGGVR